MANELQKCRDAALDLLSRRLHSEAELKRKLSRKKLAPEIIEQERQIYAQQSAGKPENVVTKIVEGKLEKFYKEVCLLEQPWVKDSNLSITDLIGEYTAKINEKLEVRRFARFQLGEATDQKNATEAG